MAPRDLITLKFDRETPWTLRSALAALAELQVPLKHADAVIEMQSDFQQELRTLLEEEAQGALF